MITYVKFYENDLTLIYLILILIFITPMRGNDLNDGLSRTKFELNVLVLVRDLPRINIFKLTAPTVGDVGTFLQIRPTSNRITSGRIQRSSHSMDQD